MNNVFRISSRWILPFVLATLSIIIYVPGLHGDFEFDDSINILNNPAIKMSALSRESVLNVLSSEKSGPLGRPISLLSFAANYYLTGLDPFFFKLTNVLVHIFAGLGVYVFIRQLTLALDTKAADQRYAQRANFVALTTAGIWLVHPLNLTSVLYVVQRMTSLAALFTFFAVALYVLGRRRTLENKTIKGLLIIVAGLGPLTVLAVLSKENGLLAPYLMLCIELTVFRFASEQRGIRIFFLVLFSALVILPTAIGGLNFDRLVTEVTNGYLQREFSLMDRLLTQPQVLIFYLRMLLVPTAGAMGLFHDDFPVASSLSWSPYTAISACVIVALIVIGFMTIRRVPVVALGILWFFVGHSMESTFLPLEMVHEHRNYLPIVGPIFVGVYYFWRIDANVLGPRAKVGIVVTVLTVLSAVTFVRSMQWSNLVDHAAIEVHNHPNSERANYQLGRIYFLLYSNGKNMEMAKLANQYFARAAVFRSSSILPVIAMIQMAYKSGVEPAPDLIAMASYRLQYGRAWEPNVVALNNLVICQLADYCRVADNDMTTLLLAALDNPNASQKTKAAVHSLIGVYYIDRFRNLELAGPHIAAAVAAEPDRIEYRLNLLRLWGLVDNLVAARAELEAARKLDRWGLQKKRLDAESALLDLAVSAKVK